ncbi:MAG: FecR domain-containing protein [Tannerella sp.]|jgi:ferric-dicitrate binding protein FerR (iron transport regulator)|nr:FecR domain-containing protein [Tannerella sp.]
MNTNYTKYTAEELLQDDCFLRSELHPTTESEAFWNRLRDGSPALAAEMDVARAMLHGVRQGCSAEKSISQEHIEALREKIDRKNRRYDRRYVRYFGISTGVAAAVCLLLAAGWYVRFAQQRDKTDYRALMTSFEQRADGDTGQVQLVLSDDRKITIDGKDTQVDYNEAGRISLNDGRIIEEETESEETAYNRLTVPPGKRSTITFNDGTRVWINSGSRIIYPVTFEKRRREIFVEGEIYLDVAEDEKRPFIVKTAGMDVKVLGTTFNVKAYEDETGMEVVLVSGKIEVETNGSRNVLAPNQMFSYDSRTSRSAVMSVDVADHIAWKDGYYPFRQQQLSEVLGKLAGYYGITFLWNEKIDSLTCSGKFDLKEDLAEVLRILEKTAPVIVMKTGENTYKIEVKP